MREIKFRAWDKKQKAMYAIMTSMFFDGVLVSCSFLGFCGDEKTVPIDDLEIMQYTGLKDKNGKEIYEGDICRYKWEGNVLEHGGEIKFKVKQDADARYLSFSNCLAGKSSYDLEVIGNIYENGDLI